MLTKEYSEQEALDCMRKIARELTLIRKVLEAEKAQAQTEITITKDGMVVKGKGVLPDLESFFERQEDDRK